MVTDGFGAMGQERGLETSNDIDIGPKYWISYAFCNAPSLSAHSTGTTTASTPDRA